MPRSSRPELADFNELNAKEKVSGIKTPWSERYALIKQYFPASVVYDWRKAFQNQDDPIYARIIRDILENDQKGDGKGPRPPFDPEKARARLRQFSGDDYTALPFVDAFRNLAGQRSIRHLQHKLDMSRGTVWKLKQGLKEPDLWTLERVADAFHKHPSYFVEYRIYYILGALGDQMDMAPEMTVDLYRRLQRKKVK